MTEEIEAHVLKKYEILQKLGKPFPVSLISLPSYRCATNVTTFVIFGTHNVTLAVDLKFKFG